MEVINYTEVALSVGGDMLTVPEFIKATNYPIDTFLIDRFWSTLQDGHLIYVDDELIRWMGYAAGTNHDRKANFVKLLFTSTSGIDYFEYSNDEYNVFQTNLVGPIGPTKIYPKIDRSRGYANQKHLLLTSECLKMTMMRVNTDRGDQVRRYYFTLEKLFKIYIEYQMKHQLSIKDAEIAINKLALIEKDKQLNRVGNYNAELLQYKQFIEKSQILYVGATYEHMRQGLFKISKTRDIKSRNATHNTTHPIGDEFWILREFHTGDALHLEKRAHHILQFFRPSPDREIFQIPYYMAIGILEKLEEGLNSEEELVNQVMIAFHQLKITQDNINWLEGAPQILALTPSNDPDDEIILTVRMRRRDVNRIAALIAADATIQLNRKNMMKSAIYPHIPRGRKNKYNHDEWEPLIAAERQKLIMPPPKPG